MAGVLSGYALRANPTYALPSAFARVWVAVAFSGVLLVSAS